MEKNYDNIEILRETQIDESRDNIIEKEDLSNLLYNATPNEPISRCNGSIFRAEVQHFQTKRGFGFKTKLQRLKKYSCSGCLVCGYEDENFSEVGNDFPIEGIEALQHKKLYSITTVTDSIDYESGVADDWHLKIVGPLDEDQIRRELGLPVKK